MEMTKRNWIPLHVHANYSLAEGAITYDKLVERCVEENIPAVAITDTNSLAGVIEFSKKAIEANIKPLIGTQISISDTLNEKKIQGSVILIAKNQNGYYNFLQIMKKMTDYEEGLKLEDLFKYKEDIIAIEPNNGIVHNLLENAQTKEANEITQKFADQFKNHFYLGIDRSGYKEEKIINDAIIQIANNKELPLVALNEAFFLDPEMHEAHDALLCIANGTYVSVPDRRHVPIGAHIPSDERMVELFADLPDALENTIAIAQRCSHAVLPKNPTLPIFPDCRELTENQLLDKNAQEGLNIRLSKKKFDNPEAYQERLQKELNIIKMMGFAGYFLIVADFIEWARKNDIAVGPGRGSGAGSLVAWALGITNLDPIRHGLLFERFLNPDRVSMPDFDIDFCQARRDEVIDYVRQKYEHDHVAQIGTYGKLQARAAVRDVGRVLQIPFPVVDRFCRMIPNNPTHPVSLKDAVNTDPLCEAIEEADSSIKHMFDIAIKLEGLFRHASTHAAGLVIADRPVSEIIPVMKDNHGEIISQFDMKAVELAGLVKFDFLGLKTLDLIQDATKMAESINIKIDFEKIEDQDQETYETLAKGESFGVFQLESSGMRISMSQIQPSKIEDLIALVSLYRPGPMENIPTYANVKKGMQKMEVLHPSLEPILKETHGVIIYQEQVMEIAQKLAGYSLGQADLLRRAMGKKIRSEMDKHEILFVQGAINNGIDEEMAKNIFALLARFADYGFNKSHAAAYADIAFKTAYLKKHATAPFFAAFMNTELGEIERVAACIAEARRIGLPILSPEVNKSKARFTIEKVEKQYGVRYAFSALRGIGENAAQALVQEREKNGNYKDLKDLVKRTRSFLNKKAYEALIYSGAIDCFKENRSELISDLQDALGNSKKSSNIDQMSLFGEVDTLPKKDFKDISDLEKLKSEHNAVGSFFSGHPINLIEDQWKRKGIQLKRIMEGKITSPKNIPVLALVSDIQYRNTKNQEPMAIVSISDPTLTYEALLFGENFEKLNKKLSKNEAYLFNFDVSDRDGIIGLIIRNAEIVKIPENA